MLEICVIDTDTGLLYEWNGGSTVNVYTASQYAIRLGGEFTPETLDCWTIGEPQNPTAEDFIASVVAHKEDEC